MSKTNKYYTCKDCKKELRKKEVTQELVDLNLCPQCYTNRIMKNIHEFYTCKYCGEKEEIHDLNRTLQVLKICSSCCLKKSAEIRESKKSCKRDTGIFCLHDCWDCKDFR